MYSIWTGTIVPPWIDCSPDSDGMTTGEFS